MSVAANIAVDSGDPDIGSFPFRNQILIQGTGGPFADLGDSGALIIDTASHQATGVLCATSDATPMTIASHIEAVLSSLTINLVA